LSEIGKAVKKVADPPRRGENDGGAENAETAEKADRARAEMESDDENDPDDDATQFKEKNRGANAYEEPDEDEAAMAKEARAGSEEPEPDNGMPEDEGYSGSPRTRSPADSADEDDSDGNKQRARDREDRVIENFSDLIRFTFDEKHASWCELSFEYDVSTAKILMLNHVEAACHAAVIQNIPGIGTCEVGKKQLGYDMETQSKIEVPVIVTDGVNLLAMRDYQHIINPHKLFTNDINAMLNLYGVEAARMTIIQEMDAVFSGHNISVDNRHLNLVADMMTRGGAFSAFNRTGMKSGVSPFMKMSFETTVGFLKDAVLEGDWDDLRGPSARIVTGKASKVGTGAFDVFMPVGGKASA
jgi:DNA-directed RNA polymerase I subunit RPA1